MPSDMSEAEGFKNLKMIKSYSIYLLISPNGNTYVGMTYNIARRLTIYRNMLCQSQKKIFNELQSFGYEAMQKIILHTGLTKEDAIEKEIELIAKFKNAGISLNMSDGKGTLGIKGKDHACSKSILQYSLYGTFIKRWDSQSQIFEFLGLAQANISTACRKKTYYAYKYLWCFDNDSHGLLESKKIKRIEKTIDIEINELILN